MKPIYTEAAKALEGLVDDNMTIAAGGFGLCGIPENLIHRPRRTSSTTRPEPAVKLILLPVGKGSGHACVVLRDRAASKTSMSRG